MTVAIPRPRDVLCVELRRLHDRRAAVQGEVLDRLTQLDALDQRIGQLIDELADTIRTRTTTS